MRYSFFFSFFFAQRPRGSNLINLYFVAAAVKDNKIVSFVQKTRRKRRKEGRNGESKDGVWFFEKFHLILSGINGIIELSQ